MKLSLETLPLDRSGNTVVTTQLQLLIDEIDHAGGGMLTIPPGIWCTGTLILPSNFTLHLEAGACLRASTNAMDYQHVETTTVAELSHMALIYARDKQRITLSGEGRIDGDAASWFAPEADARATVNQKRIVRACWCLKAAIRYAFTISPCTTRQCGQPTW